jgi:hypothetical protein
VVLGCGSWCWALALAVGCGWRRCCPFSSADASSKPIGPPETSPPLAKLKTSSNRTLEGEPQNVVSLVRRRTTRARALLAARRHVLMARPCTICLHPHREAIDKALVEGQAIRAIMRHFAGADRGAIARHQKAHLSPALMKVAQRREERHNMSLLDRLESLIARCEAILETSEQSGSVAQALATVRELRGLYELVGKVTGELKESGGPSVTFNVLQAPEVLAVIAAVRSVLADQPERLQLFSDRLRLTDGGSDRAH